MKTATLIPLVSFSSLLAVVPTLAQDWPQWLGPDRNAKVSGFKAPKVWPKELTPKWKVTIGDGVATPALVGDRLYTFSRQEGGEIVRCLDAKSGSEIWKDKYDVLPATGPASGFSGPRCTPTVADGKVVTLGLRGTVSCYNAADGKLLWRKEDFKGAWPRFFTSASPIVVDGLCIAQLGGGDNGGVIAYDLKTGDEKWKWTGGGPAYASPVLLTVSGTKMLIGETEQKIVGLDLKDGKLLWETPFAVQGRGYNASTPIVDGNALIYCGSGRGATAVKVEKSGDTFTAKELWKNTDNSVQFNTPVLRDGVLFGLTANSEFFCIGKDGKTAWTAPASPEPAAPATQPADVASTNAAASAGGDRPGGRRGGGGGGGRGGGGRGYGQIVDAGPVMLALTPSSELIAFEPSAKAYTEIARVKVAPSQTYTYPVVSGNRLYVKDQNDVMLYTLE